MWRLVLIIICWVPQIAAMMCYKCANEEPLCHDPFERSSGFESNCSSAEEICFKKITHGSMCVICPKL